MDLDYHKIKTYSHNNSETIIKYKKQFKYNSKAFFISKSRSTYNINYVNNQSYHKDKKNCKNFQKSQVKFDKIKRKKLGKNLKSTAPKIPELFNNNFLLYENDINYLNKSNYYKKINKSRIPNIFYNHLMIKGNNYNDKIFSYSITKRNKGKILNIIYYKPYKPLKS